MSATIRPASPDDARAIRKLWNALIRDTNITFTTTEKSLADVTQFLQGHATSGDPVLVAETDGKVAGFAAYHPFRSGDGYATSREVSINLDPDIQRLGIGRKMLDDLEATARQNDVHALIAGVTATNAPSLSFFDAQGFERVGYMPQIARKFGCWQDLVLMQKIL